MATTGAKTTSSATTHERLSAVEVAQNHLETQMNHVQHELSETRREQQEGFAQLRRYMSEQKQPLTAFAGWAAVVLSLVYAFGSPLQTTDVRLEGRVDLLAEEIKAHQLDGHPERVLQALQNLKEEVEENEAEALRERQQDVETLRREIELRQDHDRDLIAHNTKGVEELDGVLQREMRLLDDILQREMGLHVQRLDSLIKAAEQRMQERLQWQTQAINAHAKGAKSDG